MPQQPTASEPSTDLTNDDLKQAGTLPDLTFKPFNSSLPVNTVQITGNNFVQNNGFGAGRSLSHKTWTLINKNIKGIDET